MTYRVTVTVEISSPTPAEALSVIYKRVTVPAPGENALTNVVECRVQTGGAK